MLCRACYRDIGGEGAVNSAAEEAGGDIGKGGIENQQEAPQAMSGAGEGVETPSKGNKAIGHHGGTTAKAARARGSDAVAGPPRPEGATSTPRKRLKTGAASYSAPSSSVYRPDAASEEGRMFVAVRIRPLTPRELDAPGESVVRRCRLNTTA